MTLFAVSVVASATGFFFGDAWALLVVPDCVESELFPRAIRVDVALIFFSLTGEGLTGDGVGGGKAAVLWSGGATGVGLTGRDEPMGAAVGLPLGCFKPLPHAAELGKTEATRG